MSIKKGKRAGKLFAKIETAVRWQKNDNCKKWNFFAKNDEDRYFVRKRINITNLQWNRHCIFFHLH
jgi:hypothetical protein